jgi:dolichol-phosphate mannosyltransferase
MLQVLQTGFTYKEIPYTRRLRKAGKSRWTFSKKLKLFIDSSIAFSFFPVRVISFIGVCTAIAGFLTAVFYIAYRIFFHISIQGWTSIMVAVLVIGGLQMTMLGIIGEYIWRTYDETRKRPPYVVAEKINL